MKISLGAKNKPLDRATAMALGGINLLATPGLGTLLGGRIVMGLLQLAFSVAGFSLIMHWFYTYFRNALSETPKGPAAHWQLGLALFGVGWILSGVSSLQMVRNAAGPKPPRLDGQPG